DRDAVLTGPGHSHDVFAELLGVGSGHDAHPSRPPSGQARSDVTYSRGSPVGAFYVALIPQFIPPETPALAAGSLLGLVHVAETLLWFGLIIVAVHWMKDFFARPAVQRWTDAVAGTVITALGLRLAIEH
ncbi:LysE family translocator, partial [Kocuria palustris]|uniref:LysE family translocator n=1 Tax=Kocuria palustris TaxID=71999 RepID=UPI000AB57F91